MALPFYCHMVIYGQDIATSTYQRNKRYCGPKRNLRLLKHVSKIKERPWRNLHDQDWNSCCFSMTHFAAGKYVHRSRTWQWNPVLRQLRPPRLCDHLVITIIFFRPKRKNHWVSLLLWRPRSCDHLGITTRIFWPNGGLINEVPL